MALKNGVIWVLTIAALVGGGLMINLMHNMTHQVGLMTDHVAGLARNVTEMNHKIGAMTEHMAHMDQNMEAMTRHMGRIDQMIHQSGETFQQWNPMDMMQPRGSSGR